MKNNAFQKTLHPFPARMAPEIAFEVIKSLKNKSIVVDPMVGSGTSLRIAAAHGCKTIGIDVEPLALILSSGWNIYLSEQKILAAATQLIKKSIESKYVSLPWLDLETKTFIKFWFAQKQSLQLKKLAFQIITEQDLQLKIIFQIALSRCIVTKDKGASLARDVSHAKPHKTQEENDFDVFENFLQAVRIIAIRLNKRKNQHKIILKQGDARLINISDKSADCIITSPPYLHAVDYFRGHRLSLVWMGYTLQQLRDMRSKSIGLEKSPETLSDDFYFSAVLKNVCPLKKLSLKKQKYLQRYATDVYLMTNEWFRVLKRNRKATIVIADSFSSGVKIKTTQLIKNAALMHGFNLTNEIERKIPANRRYLPPPEFITNSALDYRMKSESVLTFLKP
jgi:DNA modification methylase